MCYKNCPNENQWGECIKRGYCDYVICDKCGEEIIAGEMDSHECKIIDKKITK